MNKSELIEAVAASAGLEKRQAEAAVSAFVDTVVARTKAGEDVSVFGFGSFKRTERAARMGRNPQTGEAVKIAASKGVKFTVASAFKRTLNTRGAAKKAAAAKATKAPAKKTTAAKASSAPAKKATAAKATKAPAKQTTVAKATKATKATKAPAKKTTATAKKAAKSVKKR